MTILKKMAKLLLINRITLLLFKLHNLLQTQLPACHLYLQSNRVQ